MKISILPYLLSLFLTSQCLSGDFTKYVNPFIGTEGHGHTYPGASAPFGMVQLSPDTRVEGWDACSGYHYSDSVILGFTHTHLSGTGIGDYGDILFMPTVGKINLNAGHAGHPGYRSKFSHSREKASPGYYSVMLDDYHILAELTTTTRVGVHRYTFPKSDSANIIIDLQHGIGPDQVIESHINIVGDHEITGYRRSSGWAKDQHLYFAAAFSKPFLNYGSAVNDTLFGKGKSAEGKDVKAYVQFRTNDGEAIILKVALSSVSEEGAKKNLDAEVPGWDFDAVRLNAEKAWNKELGKIEVSGGPADQMTTFYTALYHVMLTPNIFSDVDGQYLGMDMKIHKADGFDMYTVFSLWDTFRAEHPLLTIIDQKRTVDFIKTFLARYDESGALPVWELASNETWCMIGNHAIPVIVDAYMKGIRGFDTLKAYEAIKHSANLDHFGMKEYREYGFVPGDKESESVSKTLEYAYDDWCVAQMARKLDKKDDYSTFARRSNSWINLFDTATGFMRARVNGGWAMPFDPSSVNINYTEANSWQTSFFVPQDPWLLAELFNKPDQKNRFTERLDSMFFGSSNLTGRNQSDITGMIGQYAQGNEPDHHVPYLYDYTWYPWKTQKIVRKIMDSLYTSKPDGLCGNDDCGQMSAWFVMSALGFYDITPGSNAYYMGSPLFKKAIVHLENGKNFIINADGNSLTAIYVNKKQLDGHSYPPLFLEHRAIWSGGELTFKMTDNELLRESKEGSPTIWPMIHFISVPLINAETKSFTDSMTITLSCDPINTEIYYTLKGEEPTIHSLRYSKPIVLNEPSVLKAIGYSEGRYGQSVTAEFIKHVPLGTITLKTRYSPQYAGGGDGGLINGLRGGLDFRLPEWQGYEKDDIDATIDLGTVKDIDSVSLGCLQDNNSWIFFPEWVEISVSNNGWSFSNPIRIADKISPKDEGTFLQEFGQSFPHARGRYIHVVAKNMGTCPPWHKGAGGKAWIFADEITVKTK